MNTQNAVVGGILTSILLVSGFFRGINLPFGLTSSYLIAFLSLMGTIILLITHRKRTQMIIYEHWYLWIGLVAWSLISLTYNLLFRPHPGTTIRFFVELSISLAILIIFVYLIDDVVLKYIYKSYLVGSVSPAMFLILYPIYAGFEEVRRVGGYDLPGAVNNISQMVGVALVIAVVGIVTANDWKTRYIEIFSIPILGFALLLTGSRSAIIGVSISVLLLYLLKSDKPIIDTVSGVTIVLILLAIFTTVFNYTGWYRFTPSFIMDSLLLRFEVFATAIIDSGMDLSDIVFGGGMYRYAELAPRSVDTIHYPHNYIVSLLVHIGLVAAILFTIVLVLHLRYHVRALTCGTSHAEYIVLCTTFSLVLVLMYSMTSGRLTRVFTIWIFLGISEYLLITDRYNNFLSM